MNWQTHAVSNVVDELTDYNLYATDAALDEAVRRADAGWYAADLGHYGQCLGSAETMRWADEANRLKPELKTFDRRGRRIDAVDFHPSWHALLALFAQPGPGVAAVRQRARRALVGAGRGVLPARADRARHAVPVGDDAGLHPAAAAGAGAVRRSSARKLYDKRYDPRDLPLAQKASIWVGMGMTEKQGGSDVRSNTTQATPVGAGGRGAEYRLRGHKWFFSAPMCDAHLVVARTDAGALVLLRAALAPRRQQEPGADPAPEEQGRQPARTPAARSSSSTPGA